MADKIPTWLYRLVLADFDTSRGYNNGEPPKKRRLFCTVCEDYDDNLGHHKGHVDSVLKALKSTNQYGVPTTELSKFLNVSEVDTGSINGSCIHFLQKRRHVRGSDQSEASTSKSCGHRCYMCQWKLNNKGARFCSVECKYKPALLNKMVTQVSESPPPPPPLNMVVDQEGQSPSTLSMTSNKEETESPPPSSMVVGEDSESPPPSSIVAVEEGESAAARPKKRRRKSLPRRAPFF